MFESMKSDQKKNVKNRYFDPDDAIYNICKSWQRRLCERNFLVREKKSPSENKRAFIDINVHFSLFSLALPSFALIYTCQSEFQHQYSASHNKPLPITLLFAKWREPRNNGREKKRKKSFRFSVLVCFVCQIKYSQRQTHKKRTINAHIQAEKHFDIIQTHSRIRIYIPKYTVNTLSVKRAHLSWMLEQTMARSLIFFIIYHLFWMKAEIRTAELRRNDNISAFDYGRE